MIVKVKYANEHFLSGFMKMQLGKGDIYANRGNSFSQDLDGRLMHLSDT